MTLSAWASNRLQSEFALESLCRFTQKDFMADHPSPEFRRAYSEAGHAFIAYKLQCPIVQISVVAREHFCDEQMELKASLQTTCHVHQMVDPAERGALESAGMVYIAGKWATFERFGRSATHDYRDAKLAFQLLCRMVPRGATPEFNYYRYAWIKTVRRLLTAVDPKGSPHLRVLDMLAQHLCELRTISGPDAFAMIDLLLATWPAWEKRPAAWLRNHCAASVP
jgi:hypothetical protein